MNSLPEVQECAYGFQCRNSIQSLGEGRAKCIACRLSPDNEDREIGHHWLPVAGLTGLGRQHPALQREKRDASFARARAAQEKRQGRDSGKRQVLRKAVRAEKTTESNIIRATKNSGRSNRDGDHVAAGITLDTKMQSKRDNPVVLLSELSKVREDAKNGGNSIGALVIRNRHGVGVVAIHEDDFAKILEALNDR